MALEDDTIDVAGNKFLYPTDGNLSCCFSIMG